MPETYWTVRWPDGVEQRCYSPSSVVGELFSPGQSYPMDEFLSRARTAMERASARVEKKYGYFCTAASAQLAEIEQSAARFEERDGAMVDCVSITQ